VCGRPFVDQIPEHICSACLTSPPEFDRARSGFLYTDGMGEASSLAHALWRFKYGRDPSLANALGVALTESVSLDRSYDVVVPVPLHISRLRWRGFNQAVLLARPLVRRHSLYFNPFLLRKVRATTPQVGLARSSRKANIRGTFCAASKADLQGTKVLLLDDVITTGATANECARTLLGAGAILVDVLSLMRALNV
jgi:ComF family protein